MSWGAKVSGTVSLDGLTRKLGKAGMRQIGRAAITEIRVDSQTKGIDESGRPFAPYSADYKAARAEARYNTRPDLTVTGDMMNAIDIVAATDNSVTLGFIDSQRAGSRSRLPGGQSKKYKLSPSEKMKATQGKRPWFGFGKPNSPRRQEIQKRGSRIFIKALTKRVAGRNKGRV
jgi:hypothetical protein